MARALFAFDKFRGTATAQELVDGAAAAASSVGWLTTKAPLADGGEGSLAVLGGANKVATVSGPLGDPVDAGWRLDGAVAYIEMAQASGLMLAGGKEGNDPLRADTFGTGELIDRAMALGATTIHVLMGGSATTDGGGGALRALPSKAALKRVDLVVAADVSTQFADAAKVFGPQKGASPAQVKLLTRRLEQLAMAYQRDYDFDVSTIPGAGAAGGLAGGLLAVGGRMQSGFDVLAESLDFDLLCEDADLVVTGEGYLDAESFTGKVVGGVARWARNEGRETVAIVGDRDPSVEVPDGVEVISLTEQFGHDAAMTRTVELVGEVVTELLGRR